MDNTRRPPATRSTGEMAASNTPARRDPAHVGRLTLVGGAEHPCTARSSAAKPQVQFTSDSVTSRHSV